MLDNGDIELLPPEEGEGEAVDGEKTTE